MNASFWVRRFSQGNTLCASASIPQWPANGFCGENIFSGKNCEMCWDLMEILLKSSWTPLPSMMPNLSKWHLGHTLLKERNWMEKNIPGINKSWCISLDSWKMKKAKALQDVQIRTVPRRYLTFPHWYMHHLCTHYLYMHHLCLQHATSLHE